jgi:hypothetical protein
MLAIQKEVEIFSFCCKFFLTNKNLKKETHLSSYIDVTKAYKYCCSYGCILNGTVYRILKSLCTVHHMDLQWHISVLYNIMNEIIMLKQNYEIECYLFQFPLFRSTWISMSRKIDKTTVIVWKQLSPLILETTGTK